MATRDDHEKGMKQMPVQMHMLRHRVFFGKWHVTGCYQNWSQILIELEYFLL
jgi:hypothetical protein